MKGVGGRNIVNLHNHSHFSILDGLQTPDEMAQRAVELGQSSIAITDHGSLSGTVSFQKACQERGIKPILGCEVYMAPGSRSDTELRCIDGKSTAYHLVLLAMNQRGWNNLVRLTTMANYPDAFYRKPRIDLDLLSRYSDDLVCLSGCLGSEFAQTLLSDGNAHLGLDIAGRYRDVFGERYFIELQDHDQEDDRRYLSLASSIADRAHVPVVATADSHYAIEADQDVHDTLLAIQTLDKKYGPDRKFQFHGVGYDIASYAVMRDLGLPPEAISNTVEIASWIGPITLGATTPNMVLIPDAANVLRAKVYAAIRRYPGDREAALQRAKDELSVISLHGFDSYFLMVSDVIEYAKSIGITVGPGRGSVGGSIVAFLLGITQIDPLIHHTVFERFLVAERPKMPDIDVDFSDRPPVIRYLEQKYGPECVTQVGTFMTFGEKASLRDVARALDDNPDEASEETLDTAQRLEGRVRGISRHAAGVIISPHSLEGRIPLMRPVGGAKGAALQTAWDYESVEAAGYVKLDVLGVSRLQTIQDAAKDAGVDIERSASSLDDPDVYAMLRRGDVAGVFQLDSYGGKKILRDIKPLCFEDIVVAVALDRPGPLESGAYDTYVQNRRAGSYADMSTAPALNTILLSTYGVIVYQEQVMAIAQEVAGYSPGEADAFRAAMGKKKPEVLAVEYDKFVEGCIQGSGLNLEQAERLFKDIEYYAGYCFNRSHAVGYAMIAYQCAWLKYHYPVEWYAALLNEHRDVKERLRVTIADVRRSGIPFLGADIERSAAEYRPEHPGIRIGLTGLADVGQVAVDELKRVVAQEQPRNLTELVRLSNRSKLNTKTLTALIKAGAMSRWGDRASLLRELPEAIEAKTQAQREEHLAWCHDNGLTTAGKPRKRPLRVPTGAMA